MPLCKWHTFSMVPWLICCFIVISFYIERKWLITRNLNLDLKYKLSGKFKCSNATARSIKMLKYSWISIKAIKIKASYGDIQEYTDICCPSDSTMQFLGG